MRILALETTERIGTIAACDGTNLLLESSLDSDSRSTESLVPGLARLLDQVGWQPRQVDLVAVTVGPGSFTGLRVGVTAAKAFAYAAEADILGIDTLETIAAGLPETAGPIAAAVDAQRGDLVGAVFERRSDGRLELDQPSRLMPVDAWLAALPQGITVAGPILRKIADRVPAGLELPEERYWTPRASTVGRLAFVQFDAGKRDDVWKLVPRYSRRSAAEEKWLARQRRKSATDENQAENERSPG